VQDRILPVHRMSNKLAQVISNSNQRAKNPILTFNHMTKLQNMVQAANTSS